MAGIDFNNKDIFPIDSTVFSISDTARKNKKTFNYYVENITFKKEWIPRFSTAEKAIKEKKEEEAVIKASGKIGGIGASFEQKMTWFGLYDTEENIATEIKPTVINEINQLLTIGDGEQGIIKFLKEVGKEDEDWQDKIKSWDTGVSGIIFISDVVKLFYTNHLPTYIQGKLDETEPIKIDDLDQIKTKEHLTKIFTSIYSGFTDTYEKEHIEGLEKGINEGLDSLEKLIVETRESKKKPLEPEKHTEDIEALKKELVETKERLKIYDDTFSVLYPKTGLELAKQFRDWFEGLKGVWDDNFKSYGVLWSGHLKKVKENFDSKEKEVKDWLDNFPTTDYPKGAESIKELIKTLKESQGKPIEGGEVNKIQEELNKWLKEFPAENYPKGAEEVKIELEGFSAYIERVLDRLEKQDNYILVDEPDKITTEPEEIKKT